MKLSGFGNYPVIDSNVLTPESLEELMYIVKHNKKILAFGNNKSYGDSSLYKTTIDMKNLNKVIHFDHKHGLVKAEAGILLDDLLRMFVPQGWFLSVTPGTKFITLGGAVASNVHGKNHHKFGSFINCVKSLEIINNEGKIIKCSRTRHKDLFYATFGGMGLLGVIYSVEFYLMPVKSAYIDAKYVKCENLNDVFENMKKYDSKYDYTVAWIDTIAKDKELGKGVLILGNHSNKGKLDTHTKPFLGVPFFMPNNLLNQFTIGLFNKLFYLTRPKGNRLVHYDEFFYPLDKINDWNKIYGDRGFTQYQFVIPKTNAKKGITEILNKINDFENASFLSVLKEFKNEENYISFPKKGYTLALDIPIKSNTKDLINALNNIVLKYKGRLYLTKDAFMTKSVFFKGYKHARKWLSIKHKFDKNKKFVSEQAKRVGLI